MFNLSFLDWFLAVLGAIGIGLSKGGFPGLSMLTVGLYAHIFEPIQSIGIVLMILFLANIVAVILFRKFADWGMISRLIPFTLIGILLGYFFLLFFPASHINRVIGLMLILMVAVHFYRQYQNTDRFNCDEQSRDIKFSKRGYFSGSAIFIGLLCGFSTMVANAAGPIAIIYLMNNGLDKFRFVATMAWLFFIMNAIKIPFHLSLGSINSDFFQLGLFLGLIAIITVIISSYLIKYIPQRIFNILTWVLVLATSLKLAF